MRKSLTAIRARKRLSTAKRKIVWLARIYDFKAMTVGISSVDELSITELRDLQHKFLSLSHHLKVIADSTAVLVRRKRMKDSESAREETPPLDSAGEVGCFTGEEKTGAVPPVAEPPPVGTVEGATPETPPLVQKAEPEAVGASVSAQVKGTGFMLEPDIGDHDAGEGDDPHCNP